jgi:hypothetical protein
MQHRSFGLFACLYIPQFTLRHYAAHRGPAAAPTRGIIIEALLAA